jgi:prepilin-type N-terminal cleavage/methylation domain-containing protein
MQGARTFIPVESWHDAGFVNAKHGAVDEMNTRRIKGMFGILGRLPWRVGDAPSSSGTRTRRSRKRGFTLMEILVTTAIIGVMLAIGANKMRRRPFSLQQANQQLMSDLRATRSDALTKGDHFRLEVLTSTTYREYRLKLNNGIWTPSGSPVRQRTLPPGITMTEGVGKNFEFNTRGLLILPGQAASITLTEQYTSKTKRLTVWPSGQVAPL